MRYALWAVVIAVPSLVGAWIYAKNDLKSRFATLTHQIHAIGLERGSRLPSRERVLDRVRDAAMQLRMQVSGIDVSIEPVTGANRDRVPAGIRMIEEQAKARARGIMRGGGTGGHPDRALAGYQRFGSGFKIPETLIEIRGRARAKKWLWSLDQAFDVRRVIRGAARPAR